MCTLIFFFWWIWCYFKDLSFSGIRTTAALIFNLDDASFYWRWPEVHVGTFVHILHAITNVGSGWSYCKGIHNLVITNVGPKKCWTLAIVISHTDSVCSVPLCSVHPLTHTSGLNVNHSTSKGCEICQRLYCASFCTILTTRVTLVQYWPLPLPTPSSHPFPTGCPT